ncbi:MAG TPA: hypothetical protein VEX86_16485 [Longimicrobium sp.]|nr:hypothetical protein [Longimicrobium sp.]
MGAEPAYRIDVREDDGFTLDVAGGVLDRKRVSRFLDYLILEAAREQSELTREDAAGIAQEIDDAIWNQVRADYEGA